MPGRERADLRDRGIPTIATRMLKEMTNPTDPPGMPDEEVSSNGPSSLPGPAHPGVVAALRRWRLPRVWADTADGSEEAALPPPLAGHINLPHATGDPRAFAAIGTASFQEIG